MWPNCLVESQADDLEYALGLLADLIVARMRDKRAAADDSLVGPVRSDSDGEDAQNSAT